MDYYSKINEKLKKYSNPFIKNHLPDVRKVKNALILLVTTNRRLPLLATSCGLCANRVPQSLFQRTGA